MNVRNSIDNLPQTLQSQNVATPAQKAASAASLQSTGPDVDADKAQVSTTAAQVAKTSATSDVRPDKVASIQRALQAGTYQVPASAVAQKVISSMLSPNKQAE